MPGKCLYLFCSNTDSGTKTLFRCPKDHERSEKWLRAAGREDILQKKICNYKLCEGHFERKYTFMTSSGHKRLYNDAVPTIFSRTNGTSEEIFEKIDSSTVSVELLTENEPSSVSERQSLEPTLKKRKGIIAYRINKLKKSNSEFETSVAASEPSTSTSTSTRPINELESIYLKEEPSEGVHEEFRPEVKIENDDFYTGDNFVEPLLYPVVATGALDSTSKAYIDEIVESKSDLATLFHKLSQLAKRMDPLAQALFQSKVSNAVFQMKIQQLST